MVFEQDGVQKAESRIPRKIELESLMMTLELRLEGADRWDKKSPQESVANASANPGKPANAFFLWLFSPSFLSTWT